MNPPAGEQKVEAGLFEPRTLHQRDQVFGQVTGLIRALPVSASFGDLLLTELEVARREAADVTLFPVIDFPFALASAIGAPESALVAVVAATTVVYLGADLLDNIMDHELPDDWHGWSNPQVLLAATTLLSTVWACAVAEIPAEALPSGGHDRIRRAILDGLIAMGDGQFQDLGNAQSGGRRVGVHALDLAAVRGTAELKSGKELGMCAAVVTATVTADDRFIRAAERLGTLFGAASQIASDMADLYNPAGSRDLAAGTLTLPLAHARSRGAAVCVEIEDALLAARTDDPVARARFGQLLVRCGTVQYIELVIRCYCRAAGDLASELARELGGSPAAVTRLLDAIGTIGGRELSSIVDPAP